MSDTFRPLADSFVFGDLDRSERLSLDNDLRDSSDAGLLQYSAVAPTIAQPDRAGLDIATTTADGFDPQIGITQPGADIFQFESGPAQSGSTIIDPTLAPPIPQAAQTGSGTISLAATGLPATENFNTLSNTAGSTTNTGLPNGWYFVESGGGARDNGQYAVDTGSTTTGDTYSFGSAASTDRALGQIRSGTAISTIGAQFSNNTGATLGSLNISFTGEQWRFGGVHSTVGDKLNFQISFDATSLSTGTWIDVDTLDFNAVITAGTAGALDGNAAANRTAISATISSLSIGNGATFWIRLVDVDASGGDDGLAIDDFSLTGFPAVATPGALAINDVTLAEGNSGTTNFTFTVTRSGGTAGAVSATWTLANGTSDNADFTTTPQTGSVNFLDGETSKTITITVAGDTTVEGNDTFFVNLTAPTGGATISDGQGLGTITNDDTPPVGSLAINDVSIAEGNSGSSNLIFTVTRSGGSAGAVDATWTLTNGTTNAADFATATFTGTVSFADGQTTATITIPIAGDTTVEANETFTVTLSAPTGGATITDASGTGTITNDDVPPIANVWINEIHYDNAGTDANEFVEVAGLAGVDLTGWSIVLYNGNGGASYSTISLTGTLANSTNGFGFFKALTPNIQNGAPDGIALVDNVGRVIQFLSYEGVMTATNGPANGLTSTDIGVSQESAAIGFTLQLTGTGSSYADFNWAANVANTEGAVNAGQTFLAGTDQGQINIRDASVTEGNSGTSTITFTVSRAGGFASAATVDYTVNLDGTANAADFGGAAVFSGTLTFAAGEYTRTITLPVQGDTTGEGNETFSVALSNVTGNAVIADGAATGTIINDDPVSLTIMQIQGAGHTSAYVGQPVTTTGIVTAVGTNGYYLQNAAGDGNSATSDAVFVNTGTAPTVAVGDAVSTTGTVAEVAASGGLSVTQITQSAVVISSTGNVLPAAVLIGTGGILPPTSIIDNDSFGTYDPANDGIDFWESLEGMRVTLDAPRVVSNTTSFGETDVIVSGGVGATGANARGGITIGAPGGIGDYNPEKIQIDDTFGALIGYAPNHSIGDRLASVTGVVNYSFLNYEVLATSAVTVTQDVTLTDETTNLVGNANYLTIATYNVENMDPSDNKYTILANDIVYSLRAPDIVALQEVQDADGAGTGSDLSGVSNVQGLITAIFNLTGLVYTYVEIAPTVANSTGGEPNGNIRNGYLYQADRVTLQTGSLALLTDAAFNGSRKPLVATWLFQGKEVTTINVHFTSRGGSDALWGATQPPAAAGEAARTAQAGAVGAYVNNQLATDPNHQYMILGDWNGFYFETAQTQLTSGGGVFANLAVSLLPSEERYSYVFEGNSQLIDNILVTGGLLTGAAIDAVHLNAEFSGSRPTDHDPQVARLLLGAAPSALVLNGNTVDENQPAGTVVGTLVGTDQPGDVLIYRLVDSAGGLFAVDSATGVITTTRPLDFEAASSYSITARIFDSAGQTIKRTFTITVGDLVGITVTGTNEAERLFGGPGEDSLYGLLGNDYLGGGDGDDWLQGDGGDDKLVGGEGRDTFAFGFNSGNDIIRGFNKAEDRIYLYDNQVMTGTSLTDYNNDGLPDLVIHLLSGGVNSSITLLGIDTFAGIRVDTAPPAAEPIAPDKAPVMAAFDAPSIEYLMLI